MKKLNYFVIMAISLFLTFTNCVSKTSNSKEIKNSDDTINVNPNNKDDIYVWLLDNSAYDNLNDDTIFVDNEAESNVKHSNNPSDYSIVILDRTGPNVDEHCDPNAPGDVVYGEYFMQIPSSYNESQILKALVDSIILKKPLPNGVSFKEIEQ